MNTTAFDATVPALERVSDKYVFLPTLEVDRDMKSLGWTEARRGQPKKGLGLHYIDYSHPKFPKLEGLQLFLRVYNAHNGTAALRLQWAFENGVCLNILEPAERADMPSSVRIVHIGYAKERLIAALEQAEKALESIVARVERFKATSVDDTQILNFVFKAKFLRDVTPNNTVDLQRIQHIEQASNTAWNVFNRVQESLIRGGYETMTIVNGETQYNTARELTSIRERAKLNRKLWALAEDMLLKQAA